MTLDTTTTTDASTAMTDNSELTSRVMTSPKENGVYQPHGGQLVGEGLLKGVGWKNGGVLQIVQDTEEEVDADVKSSNSIR